jgi:hypothetical protein
MLMIFIAFELGGKSNISILTPGFNIILLKTAWLSENKT